MIEQIRNQNTQFVLVIFDNIRYSRETTIRLKVQFSLVVFSVVGAITVPTKTIDLYLGDSALTQNRQKFEGLI